ncbi:MAG TPA: DUF4404 family protein [Planctomycetaceae bacterium]|nr:DUF4404 family protein [Planctomycetaceae bacterium]
MNNSELLPLLAKLQADLNQAQGLPEAQRQELQALVAQIETRLHSPDASPPEKTLGDRLAEAMTAFEAEHPRLTETLTRIADQLATMGI